MAVLAVLAVIDRALPAFRFLLPASMLKLGAANVWFAIIIVAAALTVLVLRDELHVLDSHTMRDPLAVPSAPPAAPDVSQTDGAAPRDAALEGKGTVVSEEEGAEAARVGRAGGNLSHDDGGESPRKNDDDDEEEEPADTGGDLHLDGDNEKSLAWGRPCFIYDKPPRTGSTTIGIALRKCLSQQGFKQPSLVLRSQRSEVTGMLLGLEALRVGTISRHLRLDGTDVARLRRECGRVAYVTSCKPMRARLWSAAKYHFQDRLGNSSLSGAEKTRAVQIVELDRWKERYLEAYPYLNAEDEPNLTAVGQRLEADYVVRAENMDEDLGRLLKVLGCGGQFQNRNVHKVEEDMGFLERIRLEQGDATYRKLRKQGDEGNEEGLKRIAEFYRYAMQGRFKDKKQ